MNRLKHSSDRRTLTGNEHLWESDDFGTRSSGFVDDVDGLVHSALEVEPDAAEAQCQ